MLVLLSPVQIAEHWKLIRESLGASLPPITSASPERMTNILWALEKGEMHCWISQIPTLEGVQLAAVLTTCFEVDEVSGVKNLMVYSLQVLRTIDDEEWAAGWATLVAFAKANGANRIVAFTNSRSVVQRLLLLGGKADYVFVTYDLESKSQTEGAQA